MGTSLFRRLFKGPQENVLATTRRHARQGDAEAQFSLGLNYSSTDDHDLLQAGGWYLKAAEQGHAPAQYQLGLMYATGMGMPRNAAEALVWIRKAAEGGEAGAQYDLGRRCHRASVHERRMDIPECRIEAYKWLALASAQSYKGSDAACQQVTMRMTREEVSEARHRATAFVVREKAAELCSSSEPTGSKQPDLD